MTKPLDDSKKVIMDFFRRPQDALASAEQSIKRSMLSYQQEQDRIRRAEQQRIEEENRKAAEKLAKQAAAQAKKGNDEKAAELQQQAEAKKEEVVIVAPKVAPVAGIQMRTLWKFEVVDATLVPRDYLAIDEAKIGSVVRATKGSMTIPGVRIYSEETLAAGR
jgi:hypothetical protein